MSLCLADFFIVVVMSTMSTVVPKNSSLSEENFIPDHSERLTYMFIWETFMELCLKPFLDLSNRIFKQK